MKKKWLAALAAVVLTAGFAACQEKIPSYLEVSGTTVTGYTDDMPANLVIPKGITKIAGGAFYDCGWLESVTIPGSVKIIGEDITLEEAKKLGMNDGEDLSVFYGCRSLKSVTIEKGAKTIGLRAFAYCDSLANVTIPNSVTAIGEYAFFGCCFTSVTIPNSVTAISPGAFNYCKSLASVTIPKSVTAIGEHAFAGCDSLANVIIPNSVTAIGECAFLGCDLLASVQYGGTKKQWAAIGGDDCALPGGATVRCTDGIITK